MLVFAALALLLLVPLAAGTLLAAAITSIVSIPELLHTLLCNANMALCFILRLMRCYELLLRAQQLFALKSTARVPTLRSLSALKLCH